MEKPATTKKAPGEPLPYNPLATVNLGESIHRAIALAPFRPFPIGDEPFTGAGIYAIYYSGDFPLYSTLVRENGQMALKGGEPRPIYIGKAVPAGSRKGLERLNSAIGTSLYKRLLKHQESLKQASNLQLEDFTFRHLILDAVWIPLGESLLIEMHQPLWNGLLDGFGNHDPGGNRSKSFSSAWDTIHPGRPWVTNRRLQPSKKAKEDWECLVKTFFVTGVEPEEALKLASGTLEPEEGEE